MNGRNKRGFSCAQTTKKVEAKTLQLKPSNGEDFFHKTPIRLRSQFHTKSLGHTTIAVHTNSGRFDSSSYAVTP